MAYKIKLNITNENSIKNARQKIQNLIRDFKSLPNDINSSVAKECESRLLSYHDEFTDTLGPDPYSHSVMTRVINTKESSKAIIYGEQVIYDEFGTGDVGARSPHPEKGKYGLNDYSSGPYVSKHVDAEGHYWDFEGYTLRGVPAGKFMYRTITEMQSGDSKKIASKLISERLKKNLGNEGD